MVPILVPLQIQGQMKTIHHHLYCSRLLLSSVGTPHRWLAWLSMASLESLQLVGQDWHWNRGLILVPSRATAVAVKVVHLADPQQVSQSWPLWFTTSTTGVAVIMVMNGTESQWQFEWNSMECTGRIKSVVFIWPLVMLMHKVGSQTTVTRMNFFLLLHFATY